MELLNTIYTAAKETAESTEWYSAEDLYDMAVEYYTEEGIKNAYTGA